jgi:hypothetical protein
MNKPLVSQLEKLMRTHHHGPVPVLPLAEASGYLEAARQEKRDIDTEIHRARSSMHGSGLAQQVARGIPAAHAFMQGQDAHRRALSRSFTVNQLVRFAERLVEAARGPS